MSRRKLAQALSILNNLKFLKFFTIKCFDIYLCFLLLMNGLITQTTYLWILVSSLTSEQPRTHKAIFVLHNCTNLDKHAYKAILKYLNFRIEFGAGITLEQYECSNYVHNGNICYYLPSKDIILDWFPEYST